jgi:imidazolonepropionase-like amidohydrolase
LTPNPILITNARIFTGTSDNLVEGLNILIEGQTIVRLTPNTIVPPADTTVIDAKSRTLMLTRISCWRALPLTRP